MNHHNSNSNRRLKSVVLLALKRSAPCCLMFTALIQFAFTPVAYAAAAFTPLGVFNGTRTRGLDVSADGTAVVGTVLDPALNRLRVFRWTASGTTFGPLSTEAVAVSADGLVLGFSSRLTELPPSEPFALRWDTASGQIIPLGTLSGDTNSVALDLSADGAIVVGSSSTFGGDPQAVRWAEASGMVSLGDLPGGDGGSFANGVSADGAVIVGQANRSITQHAFRWTPETGMVELQPPPNTLFARANAVSADGEVIVGRVALRPPGPPGNDATVAFRWTQNEGMVGLGDLPGGEADSEAFDVSADGSVIVGVGETFTNPGVGSTKEAFYWSNQLGMVNLRDLLIANGATGLDGWLLTEANGVSYDGQTVVGTGIHNGVTQAFVATIPEPSTIILAIIAAAALFAFQFLRARRMLAKV